MENPQLGNEVSENPLENWVLIELAKTLGLIKNVNEILKGLVSHSKGLAIFNTKHIQA